MLYGVVVARQPYHKACQACQSCVNFLNVNVFALTQQNTIESSDFEQKWK